MSAFVVHESHIKKLAIYAVQKSNYGSMNIDPRYCQGWMNKENLDKFPDDAEYNEIDTAQVYADILYSENLKSCFARYSDCKTTQDLPGLIDKPDRVIITFEDIFRPRIPSKIQLLKMIDCLMYQSCETLDYYQSDAYKLCLRIKDAIIHSLPGYKEADWEYKGDKVSL